MDGYGIAFGGGGAKGSYEIGVWKALRELNIPISCVTGTSVGALNGAIMVQGDFDVAYEMWTTISVEKVIDFERELLESGEAKKRLSNWIEFVKNTINSRGLTITPLENMLHEVINEDKIRKSEIDFGLVTFSLTDMKPVRLFKKDIPEGKLIDYLIASACFPVFRKQEVDNKKFVDGGIYDNIPISLLIEKGMEKIIAVDVSGPGITQRYKKEIPDIINIKNSEDLGGVLDFNKERSIINMEIGYLDTMKAFDKLKGSRYYFIDEESEINSPYFKSIGIQEYKDMYRFLGMDWSGKYLKANKIIVDKIIRTIQQYSGGKMNGSTVFPAMAEITAEELGINRRRTYTLNQLIEEIMKEYERIKCGNDFKEYVGNLKRLVTSRNQVEFDREVKMSLIEGKFLISYNPNVKEEDEKIKRFRRFIAVTFPKIAIANMFISLVLSKNEELNAKKTLASTCEDENNNYK